MKTLNEIVQAITSPSILDELAELIRAHDKTFPQEETIYHEAVEDLKKTMSPHSVDEYIRACQTEVVANILYGLLFALMAFVVIDYITGVMCAINDRKLSSEVGFRGICRKVLIFLLVGIANILDVQVIGTGSVLRTAVIFFYLSNEGVSLLENAAHLGLPVPDAIKTVLEQLHDRSEKEDK